MHGAKDRPHWKRTLAIYFIGALGAGTAPEFMVLAIFRALQGAGGALFSPSFAIMRDVPIDAGSSQD